jgi:hypothetical protein
MVMRQLLELPPALERGLSTNQLSKELDQQWRSRQVQQTLRVKPRQFQPEGIDLIHHNFVENTA